MASEINQLLKNPFGFFGANREDTDVIAISSRVRLARNLAAFSFPPSASDLELKAVLEAFAAVLEKNPILGRDGLRFFMEDLTELDRELLFERRLISREMLNNPINRALFCSIDERLALMINEEDHLRIQSFLPGFEIRECWRRADGLDSLLERHLTFAFDDRLGYLTSCPTNVGTGMRASVMLHLPALVLTGEIHSAVRALGKLNFAVRGIFGEGSENLGSLFQVSNQSTLGNSELEMIEKIESVIGQIITYEKNARMMMLEKKQYQLLDFIGRSYGLLRHAYILSSKDAINALSGISLGMGMDMFSHISRGLLDEIFLAIGSAHLQKLVKNKIADALERDVLRASLVREKLRRESSGAN